jgi:Flp pilus assembly protein TadB
MEKVVRFLQYMWLMVAAISFCIAVYHLIYTDVSDALFFFFFTGMALLLFYVRKRQLKRFQNMSK